MRMRGKIRYWFETSGVIMADGEPYLLTKKNVISGVPSTEAKVVFTPVLRDCSKKNEKEAVPCLGATEVVVL
jgi:hypothetical protein